MLCLIQYKRNELPSQIMSTKNPKVLLVGASSALSALLPSDAFDLTLTEALPIALEKLRSESFDLILLDLMMLSSPPRVPL